MNKRSAPATTKITQSLITRAYLDIYQKTGAIAEIGEVADRCGLSRQTIAKYTKNITLPEVSQDHQDKIDLVLNRLLDIAMGNNGGASVSAARLYLQAVANLQNTPKTQVNIQNNQVKLVSTDGAMIDYLNTKNVITSNAKGSTP